MPDVALTAKLLNDTRKNSRNILPTYSYVYITDPIPIMLNDIYPTYVAKENISMAEYAEQLITDPNTRQKALALATELYR
jgi:hypothetical protein